MQKLKNELVQKEQEITRLLENNKALAQIIHRDNKLIPAMELAVNTFLQNQNTLSPHQLKEQGLALAAHLQTMSQERKFNLTEYQTNGQPFLPEFFQDFGLKAHTTHAGNGGSGIGLWTSGNSRKIPCLTGYYGICARYVLLYEADFTDI